jgi:hypothetical protein
VLIGATRVHNPRLQRVLFASLLRVLLYEGSESCRFLRFMLISLSFFKNYLDASSLGVTKSVHQTNGRLGKIVNPDFWKSFRIPACGFALLTILLLFRNATESREFTYIQHVASYTLGACIIEYGHFFVSLHLDKPPGRT